MNNNLYERHVAVTREKLHHVWNRPCPPPSPTTEGQNFCPLCKKWIDCKNAFCQDAQDFIKGELR